MKYTQDMLFIPQLDKELIYHYTSLSNFMSIVDNHEYWITHASFMNDRDELCVAKEVFRESCIEEGIDSNLVDDVITLVNKEFHCSQSIFDCHIFSCSLNEDNQLMWTNYANGDGVGMAIDLDLLLSNCDIPTQFVLKGGVIYSKEEQLKCISKSLHKELLNVKEFGDVETLCDLKDVDSKYRENVAFHMSVICILYSLFFKRECFKNEMEYRVVFFRINDMQKLFRVRGNAIIPYIKLDIRNNDYLVDVKIGPTNHSDLALRGISDFLQSHKCDAEVTKSDIPLRY